ncbi:MAG: elongation factor Ts [Bacteroidetes bacterium]|nr:MAG: elongation factor Ts [Bacteroidota bacterium]
MVNITPQMIKELRDKTGAGMGDCKNALNDGDGDLQKAIEILRKKGAASASKRSDRSANEGLIDSKISADKKTAVIVEVNCETDFVARNAEFVNYVSKVSDVALSNHAANVQDLYNVSIGSLKLIDLHNEILAKFSEKIEIRRFEKFTSEGIFADYIHAGNRLAVVVECNQKELNQKAFSLLRDVAMQIAAMNPQYISRNDVSKSTIEKEIEIYKEYAITEGKKPDIADKIAIGKLEKYFQEQCLLEQTFVKDPGKVVNDVIKEISQEAGSEAKILKFRRYYLGEEI